MKSISINKNKIKYINNKYGITILEINQDEEIKDIIQFENYLLDLKYPRELYENQSIYIPHYQNDGNIFISFGTIKGFNNSYMIHACNINDEISGPSGAPIMDLENKTLIGIYIQGKKINGERCGIFLDEAIKDFIEKKIKTKKDKTLIKMKSANLDYKLINQIKIKLNVEEDLLGTKVYFLNYIKNKNDSTNIFSQNYLKELNEKNVSIEINGEKAKFSKYFIPKKTDNEIIIKFKTPMTNCSCMFYGCDNIYDIDLSQFNTSCVINMESMFAFCNGLVSIDLSSLDTESVENMNNMFLSCMNLEGIKIKYLGRVETSMKNIFFGCDKLKILDLTSLDKNDNFDIKWLLRENPKFETIYVKKQCKDRIKNFPTNNIKSY